MRKALLLSFTSLLLAACGGGASSNAGGQLNNRQGINGGNYFFLRLPNSSIEVDIPVFFQSPTRPAPDVPVIPEVIVNRLPDDIGNKLDCELEAAVGVLTGRTQNR